MSPINNQKEPKYFKYGIKVIITMVFIYLAIPILLIVLAFISTIKSNTNFAINLKEITEATGPLGDTLGGTLGPIVAVVAALLTYWAFMEQVKANKKQAKQFKKQFKDQKKSNFESGFFELLKMHSNHRDQFNSLFPQKDGFKEIYNEYDFLKKLYKVSFNQKELNYNVNDYQYDSNFHKSSNTEKLENSKKVINYILEIIYWGRSSLIINPIDIKDKLFSSTLNKLKLTYKTNNPSDNKITNKYYLVECNYESYNVNRFRYVTEELKLITNNNPFALNGYFNILSPYLRTLKILLTYIYENKYINKEEKKIYFDIVRSMFSSYELSFLYLYFLSDLEQIISKEIVLEYSIFYDLDIIQSHLLLSINPKEVFESVFNNNIDWDNFMRKSIIK